MASLVSPPLQVFYDADGTPLDAGYVYIGEPNQNPETNPKAVYWDSLLTQRAAQPIRTVHGFPSNNGALSPIYIDGQYSITLRDKKRAFVTTSPYNFGVDPNAVNGSATRYPFTGDGSTVTFTLGEAPSSEEATWVFISGVYQETSTYSISGATLTFTTAPPNLVSIEVIVLRPPVLSAATDAAAVSYTPSGVGAVARLVQGRLRDRGAVTDFGGIAGALDSATAIQASIDDGGVSWFPSGTWNASSITVSSGGTFFEADWDADLTFTFDAPMRKGTLFAYGGDILPTLGQLGHPAPNKGNPWQNALTVVRGTNTQPDTTALYARTAAYIEMHTSKVHTVNQSSWGNPFKTPAVTVEMQTHGAFEGEGNGGAFRAYSTDPPASATASKRNLVGVSAVGQSNTGTGNAAWSVWGANFVAAQTSGNAPNNCIGIEVDIIHVSDATSGVGPSVGNNFTGYWAQADGDGVFSTAAFYASRSTRSSGWNYGFYATVACRNWMIYLENKAAGGQGIYVETSGAAANALVATTEGYDTLSGNGPNGLSVRSQNSGVVQSNFVVTSNATNPVNVRVGGSLKQVTQGAADSGGTGFRLLRVAN